MKTKKSSNRTPLSPACVSLMLTALASVSAFAQKHAAHDVKAAKATEATMDHAWHAAAMPAPVRHDEQGGFQPVGHCFSVKGFAGYGGFYNVFTYNTQEDGYISSNNDIGKAGFLGGLGLAYDYEGRRLFTGLDVDFQYNQPEGRSYNATTESDAVQYVRCTSRISVSFGLAAEIGARLTEQWTIYAIAGGAFAQFKHRVTATVHGADDLAQCSIKNFRPAVRFGLGMQMATPHKDWRAFVEVTRRQFATISKSFPHDNEEDTFTIKPRNDMIRLGVKYTFLTM